MTPSELRALREKAGLTQIELARLIGLKHPETSGQVTVTRWETGQRTMTGPHEMLIKMRIEQLLSGR